MVIFTRNRQESQTAIYQSSIYLSKIGLNINSGKVKYFDDLESFDRYWAFYMFELIGNGKNVTSLEYAIEKYLELVNSPYDDFRKESVLKRIVTVGFKKIRPYLRHRLISHFFEEEFLISAGYWHLNRLWLEFNEIERQELLGALEDLLPVCNFNSYHYNFIKFAKSNLPDYSLKDWEEKIERLKI
jgi:hypothetical protein